MFRLGIIYKQQGKFEDSLACFDRILRNPPSPLAHADIWFQIGHVFEQQKNVSRFSTIYFLTLSLLFLSTVAREMLMNASWRQILNTQKSFNNSDGFTIKMVPPFRTMI